MSTKSNLFRGPALWTLIAGVAIGAGSMYSVFSGHSGALAFAQPQVEARPASISKSESLAALKALDAGFATLAQYASPAVVLIKSESKGTPGIVGMGSMPRGGEGSGVIFRPDGYIVTNDHVVGGFDKVTVVLKDGREFPGKVTRAQESDIAVVKIEAKDLPTLPFADSSKIKPGEFAMAIGAPYGLENSVTIGHVSAIGRQNGIADPMTGVARFYPELIQTDAAINMGNSGGPLINVDGEVIGINSSIVSPTGGGVGIGFAISSNQARLLAETLIEKGKVTRAYLGLAPLDLKDIQKKEMHVDAGALVADVPSNGPAAAAGVKVNDVVVRVGNQPVTDQVDLRNSMLKYAPGSTVDVEVIRDGQHKTLQVKLAEPPKEPVASRVREMPDNSNPQNPFDGIPDIRDFMKDRSGNGSGDSTVPQRGNARLGVQVQDIDTTARKQFHIPAHAKGAVVTLVQPGSVAERLGMKIGDVIEAVGDKSVTAAEDVRNAMSDVQWGETKRLSFVRYTDNTVVKRDQDVTFK